MAFDYSMIGQDLRLAGPNPWVDVKAHGAVGDGVVNDAPAIQAAIDAAALDGGTVYFPPGTYLIEQSLNVKDEGTVRRRGIRLLGSNAGPSGFTNCRLVWGGSTTDPMINLYSRQCIVEHLSFYVKAGKTTRAGIMIDEAVGGLRVTDNHFQFLRFHGDDASPDTGAMTYGVQIGTAGVSTPNMEFFTFRSCYFANQTTAGVFLNSQTGQAKSHTFHNCVFFGSTYGILTTWASFYTYSCAFTQHDVAIMLTSVDDQVMIVNSNSESCKMFLDTAGVAGTGASSAPWPVQILGGRLHLSALDPTGATPYIRFTHRGPLIIQNVTFQKHATDEPHFKIWAGSFNPQATQVISIGNNFPNMAPYDTSAANARYWSFGNLGCDSSGDSVVLDDEVFNLGLQTVGGINLKTAKLLAGVTAGGQQLDLIKPDSSDNVLVGDSSDAASVQVNAKAGGTVGAYLGGSLAGRFTSSALELNGRLTIGAGVGSPVVGQAKQSVGPWTSQSLKIQAQDGVDVTSGSNSNGGDLVLASGAPGTGGTGGVPGAIRLSAGSTALGSFGIAGAGMGYALDPGRSFLSLSANNTGQFIALQALGTNGRIDLGATYQLNFSCPTMHFMGSGSGIALSVGLNGSGASLLNWRGGVTSVSYMQETNTTASATGATTTIQAQNTTGAGSTGGALDLRSGAGAAADGAISLRTGATKRFEANATGIGFFNTTPVARPDITGSRGGNAALQNLLTALANLGLITDSTT